MSRLLMSAAAAALMSAPALAQDDSTQQTGNDEAQDRTAQTEAGRAGDGAGEMYDWDTDHDWVRAAVYGEDGEQVGVVDRVRMREDGDDQVRALVLDTSGFLDEGMRHVRLLSDEATVITEDALPEGWSVSREGDDAESGQDQDGENRRWWNWGDDDAEEQASQDTASRESMDSFKLIALSFTNDEIAMMPEYAADAGMRTDGGRQAAREATRSAAQTAEREAEQDESDVAMQSANRGEMNEDASDGYDREARAGREDYGTGAQDTGVNQDEDFFEESDEDQAGDAADADDGDRTARDRQSGRAWADDESRSERLTQRGVADEQAGQADAGRGEQTWTEDNDLVGREVYAQDDARLGSVSQVQQDGDSEDAEPIALIIITDTMDERSVSLEDREWSDEERDGNEAVRLDYQDRSEFEQDSAPYGQEGPGERSGATTQDTMTQDGAGQDPMSQDAPGQDRMGQNDAADEGRDYDRSGDPMDNQQSAYGGADEDAGAETDGWTDDHAWVDTPVYSRTGSQIGDVERVRGGTDGAQPTAIVIETGGFLDLGGREVELTGSNFRLTDHDGDQVIQIRYTEDELDEMPAFDESQASDYPLSDNPMEDDESEPFDDGRR